MLGPSTWSVGRAVIASARALPFLRGGALSSPGRQTAPAPAARALHTLQAGTPPNRPEWRRVTTSDALSTSGQKSRLISERCTSTSERYKSWAMASDSGHGSDTDAIHSETSSSSRSSRAHSLRRRACRVMSQMLTSSNGNGSGKYLCSGKRK